MSLMYSNAAKPSGRAAARMLLCASQLSALLVLAAPGHLAAQSANASLAGTVVDSTGAALSGATITATLETTSARRQVQSNSDGAFTIPALSPGRYVVAATLRGFQPTEARDVVLNVNDRLLLRLELALAGIGESVTVVSETPRINTTPGIGTVIDRKFVENLPLNGRSFQALLQLTPGVVLIYGGSENGQFSANGQRANDNYFTIDGVSANASAPTGSGFLGAAGSGQLPALTAQGGTNGLVSVDALQEFRVQTSGYAPEFGRTPGGQVSLVTRSGTDVYHGSAFEYFRSDAFDATDWFVKRAGRPEAELSQHNYGGVLGGPILRHRTFVFGSYEGLNLLLPQARTTPVPTLETRRNAVPALRPYLDALPQPNDRDLGNGFADFLAVYSDPSKLHSLSLRLDHNAGNSLKLFGRVSNAPSSSESRIPSYAYSQVIESNTRSGTVGATWLISERMVHDLRANITATGAPFYSREALIGGAASLLEPLPSGRDLSRTSFSFNVIEGGYVQLGTQFDFPQRQINVVDSLTVTARSHELKFGVDFRRIRTTALAGSGQDTVNFDMQGLVSGRAQLVSSRFSDTSDRTVVFDNLSLYAQDQWRATPRLTLSYGARWDLVRPPEIVSGVDVVTLDRTRDPFSGPVSLAPAGTPLWATTYGNLAPRVGASYVVSDGEGRKPLLLKGGVGIFYGLGYGQVANAAGLAYPFTTIIPLRDVVFPVPSSALTPPALGVAPPTQLYVMDRALQLPYTVQWNISADQGIGSHQMLSVGYVGSQGHRLLRLARYQLRLTQWPTSQIPVFVSNNQGYSDYRALQAQLRHRLSTGLQAIVSYTLSRSRDTGSSDSANTVPAEQLPPELDYGYSSFDVRHLLNAALTYQLPSPAGPRLWRMVARDWGVDVLVRARSGFPLNVTATVPFPTGNGSVRPNVVPGVPFWLEDDAAPGGRRLNRLAFSVPPAQTQGDLSRGAIRGFGLSQVDLAVRREFVVTEPLRFQLRIEAFNLFNTPTFADPQGILTSASFGLSSEMLNRALSGQNALYQAGGPRSLQLAVKFVF